MSLQAAIPENNPLYAMLDRIAQHYRAGYPLPVEADAGPFGVVGIDGPHEDAGEPGEQYIRVGFVLPDGIYAEVDDGTYGTLHAFRIYRHEA